MNWLHEFLNSPSMTRIVVANYLDHVRQNTAFRGVHKYSTIEEALQDFAQRTGLSDMQKRALRREVMFRVAMDSVKMREKRDMKQVELGEAPPSILPGVRPGSEKEKLLRKKMLNKEIRVSEPPDLPVDTGLVDRGEENSIAASFKPGLVIEAADEEESLFEGMVEEPQREKVELKGTEKKTPKGKGYPTSKEKKLTSQIRHLENLFKDLLQSGTVEHPVWKGSTNEERNANFKKGEDIKGELYELKVELAELTRARRRKEDLRQPHHQAARNDAMFRVMVDDVLGIRKDKRSNLQENFNSRKSAFQKLSDEGLQEVFDEAVKKFRKDIKYRPSQGYDKEAGDYVKCMVCDGKGKTWYYHDNPSILPFWHLRTHEEELLGPADRDDPVWDSSKDFHNELVNTYLKKYPGAFLESREQELARTFESMVESARGRSLVEPVRVSTEQDKKLDYTDEALLESILYQLRRFGVESGEKSPQEMAQEVLEAIKEELDQAFPGKLAQSPEGTYPPLGKLEDLGIPFAEFQRIFNTEVSDVANWYRGTLLRRRPPTRREKVRWTSTQRQELRRRTGKQLEWEAARQELTEELGKPPTNKQIQERLKEKGMVPVSLSIYQGGCWQCGKKSTVYAHNSEEGIDSVTCPNCGAYREKLVGGKGDKGEKTSTWTCPKCGDRKILVIRDPNVTTPEAARRYEIYCDERYINDGPRAEGYSKRVVTVGHEETYTYTPIEAEEDTGLVTEEMKLGDRVRHPKFGMGTVAWLEEAGDGSKVWVDFDSGAGEKRKLSDGVGHIIAGKEGYLQITEIKVIPRKTTSEEKPEEKSEEKPELPISKEQEESRQDVVAVYFLNNQGTKGVKFLGIGDLDKEYLFLHEVAGSQIERVSYFKNRIERRAQLLRKWARIDCDHKEPFWVYRRLPTGPETAGAGQGPTTRLVGQYMAHLQRRLARAALLKAILRTE